MAYINLLPWRAVARKEQQKLFMILLSAAALIGFVIVFVVSLVYGARIEAQQHRNQYLQSEIRVLDQRIGEISTLNETKRSLQQRMALIEQLQSSRNLGTQVMDAIAQAVPAGVYLTQLEKKGNALLLIGKSESNNRVSNLLREAEESALLSSPLLEFIEADNDNSSLLSNFKMHLKVEGYDAVYAADAKTSVKGQTK